MPFGKCVRESGCIKGSTFLQEGINHQLCNEQFPKLTTIFLCSSPTALLPAANSDSSAANNPASFLPSLLWFIYDDVHDILDRDVLVFRSIFFCTLHFLLSFLVSFSLISLTAHFDTGICTTDF